MGSRGPWNPKVGPERKQRQIQCIKSISKKDALQNPKHVSTVLTARKESTVLRALVYERCKEASQKGSTTPAQNRDGQLATNTLRNRVFTDLECGVPTAQPTVARMRSIAKKKKWAVLFAGSLCLSGGFCAVLCAVFCACACVRGGRCGPRYEHMFR